MNERPIFQPVRGLSRIEAARYVGVGVSMFDQMVEDGRMPQPKRINTRKVWDKVAIDLYFSDLPDENTPQDNAFDRVVA